MQIRLKDHEGVSILRISGEINISNVPELKKAFKKVIDNKVRKVLLNFFGGRLYR